MRALLRGEGSESAPNPAKRRQYWRKRLSQHVPHNAEVCFLCFCVPIYLCEWAREWARGLTANGPLGHRVDQGAGRRIRAHARPPPRRRRCTWRRRVESGEATAVLAETLVAACATQRRGLYIFVNLYHTLLCFLGHYCLVCIFCGGPIVLVHTSIFHE